MLDREWEDLEQLRDVDAQAYEDIVAQVRSWPFDEARRLWKAMECKVPRKGFVLFASGYGPSGSPHIGTVAEVARVSMVMRAFNALYPDIPTQLYVFSDDLDALRKVPTDVPNADHMLQFVGRSVCSMPDPWGERKSYAAQMTRRLCLVLDKMGLTYEIRNASEQYSSGVYDKVIKLLYDDADEIRKIVIDYLGPDRQKTYEPFIPISPSTGQHIMNQRLSYSDGTVLFTEDSAETAVSVYGGGCKLQWYVDWALRWMALDVDYEMYGKDISTSAEISKKICALFGRQGPVTFQYELFTDEQGLKISKSKGNGIALEDWMAVSSPHVLMHYLYFRPERARRLCSSIVVSAHDEYIASAQAFPYQNIVDKLQNPVWYVHGLAVPRVCLAGINYSCILLVAKTMGDELSEIMLRELMLRQCKASDVDGFSYSELDDLIRMVVRFVKLFNDVAERESITSEDVRILRMIVERLSALNSRDGTLDKQHIHEAFVAIAKLLKGSVSDVYGVFYKGLLGSGRGPKVETLINIAGAEVVLKKLNAKVRDMNDAS